MHRTAKQIYTKILAAKHILLIPHQHPDGDALGSCTALMEFLDSIGKTYTAFCATDHHERFSFLPKSASISTDPVHWKNPALDMVIVLDSGDLRYAGVADAVAWLKKRPTLIAIDHHATNERYGDLNLVDPTASSTTEMLHRFFTCNDIPITPRMATALLTGLLTDTDTFTNAATSSSALAIGHDCVMRGAEVKKIIDSVFRDKSVSTLRLWGKTFSRLEKHEGLNLVYTFVSQDDFRSLDVSEGDVKASL